MRVPSPFALYVLFGSVLIVGYYGFAFAYGCVPASSPSSSVAPRVNVIARVHNEIGPVLVEAYRQGGLRCVERASTASEARTCFATLDQQWDPVWAARRDAAAAVNLVAGELERGAPYDADARALERAWCTAAARARLLVPTVPRLEVCAQ